jgi:cyclopropane-fatty-acyl-phospholipid synthase
MQLSDMTDSRSKASSVARAGNNFARGDGLVARALSIAPNRMLDVLHARLRIGQITAHLPSGDMRTVGGHGPGPHAYVTLNNWRALRRLIVGGHTAWAAAYIDGDWDSPDLTALFELFSLNRKNLGTATTGNKLLRGFNHLLHRLRANTRDGSKQNISFHYDLGNDFYAQWLDPSMTYSSAIFAEGDNDLETAQRRKYRRLLDALNVEPGQHILEIGCGWGGFAEMAAQERGARVTGITLSQEQLDYGRARIAAKGLQGQVDLQLIDYRDVQGTYDHIASIEMFEAVGENYWQIYMDKVKSLLAPGGRAALQIITIDEAMFETYRRGADFIQTYIFPGGMLPSLPKLRDVTANAGLTWRANEGFALHYADTLKHWHQAFNAAIADTRLPAGFDAQFQRIWRYYLTYCEGGFRGGALDVQHIALQN